MRGEVIVELVGSRPERFVPGMRVFLAEPDSADPGREAVIEAAWMHDQNLVLKFEGIDDRTGSDELKGLDLRIPMEERPPAPEGEYYFSDLIGCRVETTEGRTVGEVRAYMDFGASPLLEVWNGSREILVPFVEGVYRQVDLEGRRIVVNLPEGLEDL